MIGWSQAPHPSPGRGRAKSPPSPDGEALDPRRLETPEVFAAVFDRYHAEIHRYVARRLDATAADDIAAETFLIAYRKRASYDEAAGTVRAWLHGIATMQVARHRRDEVRAYRALQRAATSPEADYPIDEATDRVAAGADYQRLAGALAALSQGDRDVLSLVGLSDLSHAEVAAALGIPYGTVASRLNRARHKMRRALGTQP